MNVAYLNHSPNPSPNPTIAILTPHMLKHMLEKYIIQPLVDEGVDPKDIITIQLKVTEKGTCTAKDADAFLKELQPELDALGVNIVLITMAPYLKKMSGVVKIANLSGTPLPSKYGSQTVYKCQSMYLARRDPEIVKRIKLTAIAVGGHYKQGYPVSKDVAKTTIYPNTNEWIKEELDKLLQYKLLACDIEGFGLGLHECMLGSIAFAWNKREGVAFAVDYKTKGVIDMDTERRKLVSDFLSTYHKQGGSLMYHGATFDIKQLIFNLRMNHDLSDMKGLVDGAEEFCENAHCTKLMAYLGTNSTKKAPLSLKYLASEYLGSWAIDIKNIRDFEPDVVLEYNLLDCLGTFYLYEKFLPIMEERNQLDLYRDKFLPDMHTLVEIELHGIPMDSEEVASLYREMAPAIHDALTVILHTDAAMAYVEHISAIKFEEYKAKLKSPCKHTLASFIEWKQFVFLPGSPVQLQWVLFTHYGFEIGDTTKTGQPSTGASVLEGLLHQSGEDTEAHKFLTALLDWTKLTKIMDFVLAFIKFSLWKDGHLYLFGGLNLGGTISGRLSSSNPNLQNMPSGGYWGGRVKRCFRPPAGYMWNDADFSALEAMTAALQSNDKNMLNVYIQGYDSHCLATYAYADGSEDWYNEVDTLVKQADLSNDIAARVVAINLIKKIGSTDRKKGKGKTFAFTYFGDHTTIMRNFGTSKAESKRLHKAFLDLYPEYFSYIDGRLQEGAKQGYVLLFFGLRLDLPALSKCKNWNKMTSEESAEYRSAGNAIGQSTGQLNNRACTAFRKVVRASKYRYEILVTVMIHDAIYTMSPKRPDVLEFINKELVNAMLWQDDPKIAHPVVKLGAEIDHRPDSWDSGITLENNATPQDLLQHF